MDTGTSWARGPLHNWSRRFSRRVAGGAHRAAVAGRAPSSLLPNPVVGFGEARGFGESGRWWGAGVPPRSGLAPRSWGLGKGAVWGGTCVWGGGSVVGGGRSSPVGAGSPVVGPGEARRFGAAPGGWGGVALQRQAAVEAAAADRGVAS